MLSDFEYIVVGAGITGASVACYLHARGARFAIVDDRQKPPGRARIEQALPKAITHFGSFEVAWRAPTLVLSPGLAPEAFVGYCDSREIIGDIELFVRQWHKPIVAITGTNGKSTVVSLIHHACQQASVRSAMIGNIGTAVLDQIDSDAELAVIELSSFQLLTTHGLRADVAVVLNITPDHVDRHGSFAAYKDAKQGIFTGARSCVVRADDPLTKPPSALARQITIAKAKAHGVLSVVKEEGKTYLYDGEQPICDTSQCALRGAEVAYTLLTAYAVARLMNLPLDAFVRGMCSFKGLPHRMEYVATLDGVDYINDSKATNVGATIKATQAVAHTGKAIILLGGDGKGADFSPLVPSLRLAVRLCVVYGTDDSLAATIANAGLPHVRVVSLQEAVQVAERRAHDGDTVLLSPACASFDQFPNFIKRGEAFVQYVAALHNQETACTS